MTYVFLDTETTGLDPENHDVWETFRSLKHYYEMGSYL